MTKTKAAAGKKKSKSGSAPGSRKPVDFGTVRNKIDNLVGKQAVGLVESAIAEADKGHFPAMKYLFEMTGLYPAGGQEAMPGEDSLAKTLLLRLGVPEEPLVERSGTKDSPTEGAAPAADTLK